MNALSTRVSTLQRRHFSISQKQIRVCKWELYVLLHGLNHHEDISAKEKTIRCTCYSVDWLKGALLSVLWSQRLYYIHKADIKWPLLTVTDKKDLRGWKCVRLLYHTERLQEPMQGRDSEEAFLRDHIIKLCEELTGWDMYTDDIHGVISSTVMDIYDYVMGPEYSREWLEAMLDGLLYDYIDDMKSTRDLSTAIQTMAHRHHQWK